MSSIQLSATVVGRRQVRFVASTSPDFSSPIMSAVITATPIGGLHLIARGEISGLAPDTSYYIGVMGLDGRRARVIGRCTTPKTGVHSFSFGFSSCSSNTTTHPIFGNIRAAAEAGDIQFFFHLGDLHYRDINTNSESVFHTINTRDIFQLQPQRKLYLSLPMYYIWDDHDFGPNDGDKTNNSRPAAVSYFRRRVPTAPFAASGEQDAVYYSFSQGRIRFIVTDLMSDRDPAADPDTEDKVMMIEDQLNWFFSELLAARAAGQAVIWANSKVWIQETGEGSDQWGLYDTQRQVIADFITENSLANRICIISGDDHMTAYDDGTSVNNPAGLIVCQAGAIDASVNNRGGPYKTGPLSGTNLGQWAIMHVTDTGEPTIAFNMVGLRTNHNTGVETEILNEAFVLQADTD